MEANSVSIATDLTSGIGLHVMYQVQVDYTELAAPMDWGPGAGARRHSLAKGVRHKGAGLVLDGHDLGPMLPHGPCDFILHSLKSSRKTIYSASTVIAEKKPVACADLMKDTFMMVCGDPIAFPTGINDCNVVHTVMVGMSELDYLKGHVAALASVATDVVATALSFADPSATVAAVVEGVAPDVFGLDWKKATVGYAANLAGSVVVSAATGWREPIACKLEVGSSYGGVTAEWTYSPGTGEGGYKASVSTPAIKLEGETDYTSKVSVKATPWGSQEPTEKTWGIPL